MNLRGVTIWILGAALLLTACAPKMIFVRLDGQHVGDDPVLTQQFQIDSAVCNGEMQKANLSGVTFTGGGLAGAVAAAERSNSAMAVGAGCMAGKGYAYVKEEEAESHRARFAAVEAERKKREISTASPSPARATASPKRQ